MSSSTSADTTENRYTYSEVRTERIVYNWSIKSFSLLTEGVGEYICSPWFYSQDKSDRWNFQFYPRGEHDSSFEDIAYVGLYLARDSPGKSPIEVCTIMRIFKSNKTLRNISFTPRYEPQDVFGYPKFLARSELLATHSSDNDQFTISCITDIPVEIIPSLSDATIFDSKRRQLSDDFRLLFENPIFNDFTIIVGDQKFPTHRSILSRRSTVFAAMFEHKDLEENRNKEMKIENIEPDVIKGMLEFIYTDQVTNIEELASGLLEAADKYDLEKLRIMCEKTLHEGLNKENAAELLLLANLHRAETLKKYVMNYIVDHAPDVIKSNNWKKIVRNPELLLELFNQLVLPRKTMKKLKVQRRKSRV